MRTSAVISKTAAKSGPSHCDRTHLAHDIIRPNRPLTASTFTTWSGLPKNRNIPTSLTLPASPPLFHSIPRCHASSWKWWRSTTPRSPNTGTAARTAFRDNWKLVSPPSTNLDKCTPTRIRLITTSTLLENQSHLCPSHTWGTDVKLLMWC